jgi:hypothetical protein
MRTWTDATGRTWTSTLSRPFAVVLGADSRRFASLRAAVAAAPAGSRLFFDYTALAGKFIGYAGEVAA